MEGYNIQLIWDDDAKVWIATSDDIPGLILEDESADRLIQRIILAAPEIIELNSMEMKPDIYCRGRFANGGTAGVLFNVATTEVVRARRQKYRTSSRKNPAS